MDVLATCILTAFFHFSLVSPHFLELIHKVTEDEVGNESAVEIGNKVLSESITNTGVLSSLEHTAPRSTTGVCGGEDESKVEEDENEVEMNVLTERSKLLDRGSSKEGQRRASRKCPCCEIT